MCALRANISGTECLRCGKAISPEKLNKLGIKSDQDHSVAKEESITKEIFSVTSTDAGSVAALKVNKFGLLFEKIGSIANVVNNAFPAVAILVLMATEAEFEFYLFAIVLLPIFWGLGYLQIAALRGLASYFQMKSIDFLERRSRN
jgi:hypothetical protein